MDNYLWLRDFSKTLWDKYNGWVCGSAMKYEDDHIISDDSTFWFDFQDINQIEYSVEINTKKEVAVYCIVKWPNTEEFKEYHSTILFDDLVAYLDQLPITAQAYFRKKAVL